MITEDQILYKLDHYKSGYYCQFIDLGHAYSYLIDCRLNIFKGDNEQWAIAAERLGYNPRAGRIEMDIYYFGNCIINLENYNNNDTNFYTVQPIEWNSFIETTDGEILKENAQYWIVRSKQVELCHNKQNYTDAGIELKEYEPGEIRLEEIGRLLITKHPQLFRATDDELYKSIPKALKKILVINEWNHRDFIEIDWPDLSDEHIKKAYEFNKNRSVNKDYMDYDSFINIWKRQAETNNGFNRNEWENNRPSACETWQLLAKVIATGDISFYKPTLQPNTHWKNWHDSGSL